MNEGVKSIWRATRSLAIAAVTGAPDSGSHTKTFVSGRSARSALAIPVVRPPPPQGLFTAY
jgi:hypothetical protein